MNARSAWILATSALLPATSRASFLSGDALDSAANVLSWIVIVFVPLAAIGLFLFVHVLPEKIAEKRQHPHKDSIKVLCILSLFFGGLLWPFAWLWAYTKPIGYKAIYGTEKHDDHFLEMVEQAEAGKLTADELAHLRAELAGIAAKGTMSPELKGVVARLDKVSIAPAPAALPPAREARVAETAGGTK